MKYKSWIIITWESFVVHQKPKQKRKLTTSRLPKKKGWAWVKANLSRIIEYGIKHKIIVRGAPLDDDEQIVRGRRYLDIPVRRDESLLHSAIPFLPLFPAVLCCTVNFLIPGLGTMISGLFVGCIGQPRIYYKDDRIGSTIVINFIVGICQIGTITFLLVGWFWSIAWGCLLVIHAVEYDKALLRKKKEKMAMRAIKAISKNGVMRMRDLKELVQGN